MGCSIKEVRRMERHKKQVVIERETTAVTVAPITIKINFVNDREELARHLSLRLRKLTFDSMSIQGH